MGKYPLALLLLLAACGTKETVVKPAPAIVDAAEVMVHTIPIFIEGIGNVRAYNSAEIKAQVEGRLIEANFDQGQIAAEGQLLFVIDPRPYAATLEEKEGAFKETLAQLNFAKEKVVRYTPLVKEEYVSQLNYDEYVTNVLALEGQLQMASAAVEVAKVNLDYCYVKAPFTGLMSRRYVDPGNIITNAGQTILLLNQIQPIYVDFSIPEKEIIRTLEAQKKHPLKVHVQPQGCDKVFEGEVLAIGNEVNKKTGMVMIRAIFANEEMLLWPGQFTKAHLILDAVSHAIVIPESAVSLSQKGPFVFLVGPDGRAHYQAVTLGEQIGNVVYIKEGLKAGQLVVTNGLINVHIGQELQIQEIDKTFVTSLEHESF